MPIELLGMADASTCRIGHDDSMGPAGQRQGCASPGFARPWPWPAARTQGTAM